MSTHSSLRQRSVQSESHQQVADTINEASTLSSSSAASSQPPVTTAVDKVKEEVRKVQLYLWDELPEWQKDNCYILSGYVRETFSYLECLRSLTYLHNESVNIYTHLIPGIAFFFACIFSYRFFIDNYETTTWKDNFIFILFALGASAALSLSSSFHCLKCHSEYVASFGNKLDYLGIILLIITSMVSLLYYALIDTQTARNFFWGLTFSLGAICTVFSLSDKFRTNEWRAYRALMFVLFGLSGIFPIIYGAWLYGLLEVYARSQLKWIILEGVFYCFGAFLYAVRIPERFSPGKFDLIGHSHQIFHVLVVVAAFCHAKGLVGSYHYCHQYIIPTIL